MIIQRLVAGRLFSLVVAATVIACSALPGEVRAAGEFERTSPKMLAAFRKTVAMPSESTVRIQCDGKDAALGTIVSTDGFILTKASQLTGKVVCQLKGGKSLEVKEIARHKDFDLALLKIESQGLKPIMWRDSKLSPVGNWLATPGLGADPVAIGVVSVAARAIPKPKFPWELGGTLPKSYLGIGLDPIKDGVKIGSVMPGTAAAKAGLKVNDLILTVDGKLIKEPGAVMDALKKFKPKDIVIIKIKRGMEELELKATLGKRPPDRGNYQNRLGSELSKRRFGFPVILQHDTVIKPTDCGGPIVDLDGQAIGINIARAGRTETYAIPAETVLPLLKELSAGKLTVSLPATDNKVKQ